MSLVSLGIGGDGVERFTVLRLTRKEAAKYVGLTESGVRDAERRGLPHVVDRSGQVWLAAGDLDAWTWRAPLPSPARRRSVLAAAEKARSHEARILAQLEEKRLAALEREEAEEIERHLGMLEEEDRLRNEVRIKNDAARAEFLHGHLDESATGLALGLDILERRRRIRELKAAGLLREVAAPRELVVVTDFEVLPRMECAAFALVRGGPFYVRDDVVKLRAEQNAEAQARGAAPMGQPESASVFWQLFAELVRGASGH